MVKFGEFISVIYGD